MGHRTVVGMIVAAVACLTLTASNSGAEPTELGQVPPRTSMSVRTSTGLHWGTANEHEPRTGLSIVKLYIVDYALRHGDGSEEDRAVAERMIRYSDDGAASVLEAKYPQAIGATAAEYQLPATHQNDGWGTSYTSTADVADFLNAKLRTDPGSPMLEWMATAGDAAADGTPQNWGTAQVPGVLGSKWGWSDFGPPEVVSASFGPGYAIAAHTSGTTADQTADVLSALSALTLMSVQASAGDHGDAHAVRWCPRR